jgi:hypothetical protein
MPFARLAAENTGPQSVIQLIPSIDITLFCLVKGHMGHI